MNRLLILLVITLFTFSANAQKSKVSVLYVGLNPAKHKGEIRGYGSKESKAEKKLRWADFNQFLNQHFKKVKMIHSADYLQSMSDNYDVTIFDARPTYIKKRIYEKDENGNVTKYEPAAYLTNDYSAATITMSHLGSDLGASLKTKIDWC